MSRLNFTSCSCHVGDEEEEERGGGGEAEAASGGIIHGTAPALMIFLCGTVFALKL